MWALAQLFPRLACWFTRSTSWFPAVVRGGARCASQVLDCGAQADARGAVQIHDVGAQAVARGAAR